MAEEGTRRGENSFKLNCRNNIFVNTVAVFSAQARVENFKTGRGNHGADFNYLLCRFHVVINRLGDTGFHALITFRADAAIEATHRFRDGLRLAETNTNFLEISNAVFGFHVRIFFTRNFRDIRYVRFIRQIFCPVFLAAGFHIHALQIAVDGLSRFLTGINCFYNSLRAGGNVTAGKNTGNVCRVSDRVIIQIFPFINRYAAFLCDERQIRFLADSRNNGVALDDEFGTFDFHGTAASAGIRLTQFHTSALNSSYFSIFAHHTFRGHEEFHFNSFFQRFFDFFRRSRHFGAGPAIQNEYFFRAGSDCYADSVHRDVTAADNSYFVTQLDLCA